MTTSTTPPSELQRTNGAGAAALLAAGIGSFALGVLTMAGDKLPAVRAGLVFYKPTGPLSGVTTTAVAAWLASWAVLQLLWSRKQVPIRGIFFASLVLLLLALLLTFPPVIDLL